MTQQNLTISFPVFLKTIFIVGFSLLTFILFMPKTRAAVSFGQDVSDTTVSICNSVSQYNCAGVIEAFGYDFNHTTLVWNPGSLMNTPEPMTSFTARIYNQDPTPVVARNLRLTYRTVTYSPNATFFGEIPSVLIEGNNYKDVTWHNEVGVPLNTLETVNIGYTGGAYDPNNLFISCYDYAGTTEASTVLRTCNLAIGGTNQDFFGTYAHWTYGGMFSMGDAYFWINKDETPPPPPDTRRLIKVGVVLMESADVDHNAGPFTARPCKLEETPAKTYIDGHTEEYYNDIVTCLKDYYRENLYDTVRFEFDFIGDGQWYSGENNESVYAEDPIKLGNEVLGVNDYDPSQYDIVLGIHSGTSYQLSKNENKIHTQIFRHQAKPQVAILSEDDRLGGWVHEIGHAMGILLVSGNDALTPDLYKMGMIGEWDVMANGSENGDRNDPPNMSSYTKQYLGLLNEDIHPISDYRAHWIDSLETSKNGDSIFRYNLEDNTSAETQRYYLIEARNKNLGTWDSSVPTTLLKSEDVVLYYINTKGNTDPYGYNDAGDIKNELRTVTIPPSTGIPGLNNKGVLAINDVYRDLDDMIKFTPIAERTVDSKYSMQVDIQPIDKTAFTEKLTGIILRGNQSLWHKLFGKTSPDSFSIDQKTGEKKWNVNTTPPLKNKIFEALDYYSSLIYVVLLLVASAGLLVWLLKRFFINRIKSERFKKGFPAYSRWLFLCAKISLLIMIILTVSLWVYRGILNSQDTAYVGSGEAVDITLPDLDLHAYCPGDKHIGMNYETGEFENQVPDSIVSGYNGGAPEWIYVPATVTGCQYFVSSERNQKYLDEHPEVAATLTDASDSYELYARYVDPTTGIFTSSVQTDQVIQPGVMLKHEVSGTTEIAVTPGVVGTPNEPPPAPVLFCPLLSQSVTYSALPPAPVCTFTNGPKTLQLKDSSCNPIAGARVNMRKANGAYLTYALTDANGLADLSGYANPDASYFELDYHGATYSTDSGTFSTGTGVQTHQFELSLKGSDCAPITGARVNLRKTNGAYVTYALTNIDGKASFEVVPNASMKLETDYRGGTWMSEARVPDTAVTLGTDKYALILTDNADGAISNARINLRKENSAYVTYAMTNGSGTASFEVLPNVPMVFEVDYNGATYQTAASATHEENRISTIPFGARLQGSNGTPIPGARVNLRKSNDAYVTYVLTDVEGVAVFQVVPGAQMKLEVDYHGAAYLTDALDAATSPSVTIQSKLFGLRLINNVGDPISGARVNLRKANGAYVTYVLTNADGSASFDVVPGAQMRLEVDYRGGTYQTEISTVSEDTTLQAQTSPITIHLTAQGQPLVNTRTDLLKENGAYVTYGMTGVTGDVIFEVLPNTLNKVRAVYNGTSWVSDAVTGGSVVANDF